jgi:Kef-type K+ transport system membrane component KefB
MFNVYNIIIGLGLLVTLSYVFDILSKKSRIPSVLMLIATGLALKQVVNYYDYSLTDEFFNILQFLGIIGLIMIVLEAAVDLKLSKNKFPAIKSSILMALLILLLSSLSFAIVIMLMRGESFFNSLVYAIPLSVVSSAVVIPSVHSLSKEKKEFIIYEATFSDIIGIMFFNFVVLQGGAVFSITGIFSILITIAVSFILSYIMVYFFGKIKTQIKFFLIIAILTLLYSIGKGLHLSSLLIIFIFGLVLNNTKYFFKGRISEFIDFKSVYLISKEFKMITAETAFLVRTFFFIAFGMSIDLNELIDPRVWTVGSMIVILLYTIRYINFKLFIKSDVFPEIFLAPRGLITILLFYSIPAAYLIEDLNIGIISFVILVTGIIMMIALIAYPNIDSDKSTIIDIGSSPATQTTLELNDPSGPYCEIENKQ